MSEGGCANIEPSQCFAIGDGAMNKWLVVFISATCLAWFGCRAQEVTPDVNAPQAEVDVIEADVIEMPEGEVIEADVIETPEGEVIEADVIEGEAVMDVPTDVPPEAEADVLEEKEEQE